MRRSFMLMTLLALLAGPAAGTTLAEVLRLDPAATKVTFTLDSTFHQVHGRFELREGTIRFDPATGQASGRVVVGAATGSTDNARRDRKMHGAVLESERFPDIALDVQRLSGTFAASGDSEVDLVGLLDLHGATHEVSIPAKVHVEGSGLTGTASLTVPYVAWGLEDPSVLVLRVGKEVQVTFELAGTLEAE